MIFQKRNNSNSYSPSALGLGFLSPPPLSPILHSHNLTIYLRKPTAMEVTNKTSDNGGSSSLAVEAEKIWSCLEFLYTEILLPLRDAEGYGYIFGIPNFLDCKDDVLTCLRIMLKTGHIAQSSPDQVNRARRNMITIPVKGRTIRTTNTEHTFQVRMPPVRATPCGDGKDKSWLQLWFSPSGVDLEVLQFCCDIFFGGALDGYSKWEGHRIISLRLGSFNYKKQPIRKYSIGTDIGFLTELQKLQTPVWSVLPSDLSKLAILMELHLEWKHIPENYNPHQYQKDRYRLDPLHLPSLQKLRLQWDVVTPELSTWLLHCKFENLNNCEFNAETVSSVA